MSNNVIGFPTSSLISNDALIVDLARFAEGSLTEKQVRRRYKFSETIWQRMAEAERLETTPQTAGLSIIPIARSAAPAVTLASRLALAPGIHKGLNRPHTRILSRSASPAPINLASRGRPLWFPDVVLCNR